MPNRRLRWAASSGKVAAGPSSTKAPTDAGATAFVTSEAHANLPAWGQGVILVPPAKRVDTPTLKSDDTGPGFKRGKIIDFAGTYEAGSIIVISKEHALYYVLGNGKAVKYRVATGKHGFEWSGIHKVSSKVKWPEWNPPEEMRQRRPELPEHMAG